MTIKIEIEVPTDLVLKGVGSEYLDMAAGALGFARGVSSVSQTAIMTTEQVRAADEHWVDAAIRGMAENAREQGVPAEDAEIAEQERNAAPKRERGKPSPGRARRTKEEIAEDEAADMAEKRAAMPEELGRIADEANGKPAISTGEERIGPEDREADAQQDAADEAAETEKTGLAPIDVLRRLVGDYQKKHGMPAAVKLCQEGGLIGKPIHELDDAGIEAAIAAMQGGAAPAKAEEPAPVEDPAALKPKTKADLVEAMMRYADKYDGTRDQAKMVHTLADMPKVFIETFGEGVDKLSKVPADKYAEAVAAVEAAIEADPYGRAK
jgi:hypothetical protein